MIPDPHSIPAGLEVSVIADSVYSESIDALRVRVSMHISIAQAIPRNAERQEADWITTKAIEKLQEEVRRIVKEWDS